MKSLKVGMIVLALLVATMTLAAAVSHAEDSPISESRLARLSQTNPVVAEED